MNSLLVSLDPDLSIECLILLSAHAGVQSYSLDSVL